MEPKVGMYFRFSWETKLQRVSHVEPDNNVMAWESFSVSGRLDLITTFRNSVASGAIIVIEDVCDGCSSFQVPLLDLVNLTMCPECWKGLDR